MAMTVLMKQTRQGDAGAVLSAGSTYTVTEALGAQLVGNGFATDVNGALQPDIDFDVSAKVNGVTGGSGVSRVTVGAASSLFSAERNDIVLDGDSITARYLAGTASTDASSYFAWFNAMMGQAFRVVGMAAVSGQTSSACLARFDDNVAPLAPGWVSLMVGINNIGTPDQVIADITAYIAKVRGINARLLLWTVLPSATVGFDDAKRGGWTKVNDWIMSLQGRFDDIIVIPAHTAWMDPTLSTYFAPLPALVSDGTHPTVVGAQRIGSVGKASAAGLIRPGRPGALNAITWAMRELVINPQGNGSASSPTAPFTGTLPTYWTAARESGATSVACALSIVARTDGIPGTYVRAAFSGATAAERFAVSAANRGAGTTLADSMSVSQYRRYLVPGRADLEVIAMSAGTTSTNVAGAFSNAIVGGLVTNGVQFLIVEAIVIGATYQYFSDVEWESGGTGAANAMLIGTVQNAAFANLVQPSGLFNDGTSYGGVTGEQITGPMTLCTPPFIMPAAYAYFSASIRIWTASGSSGALRIKNISLVRVS